MANGALGVVVACRICIIIFNIVHVKEYISINDATAELLSPHQYGNHLTAESHKHWGFGHATLYQLQVQGRSYDKCNPTMGGRRQGKAPACLHLFFDLLICGDIHPCPGPVSARVRIPKFPCTSCGKGITAASKAISCNSCGNWTHLKCGDVSSTSHNNLVSHSRPLNFICVRCAFASIPGDGLFEVEAGGSGNRTGDSSSGLRRHLESDVGAASGSYRDADRDSFSHFQRKGLHFLHLNARSLLPKIEELKLIAKKSRAAVIGITESWLDSSVEDIEIEIPGYNIHRRDRDRHGGGVCLYIKSNLPFNPRRDQEVEGLEAAWVEILLPKTRPIAIGVCYRPPKQQNFYELLEKSCNSGLGLTENECILMGDFNTDILKNNNKSILGKALANFNQMYGLTQLVNEPTRISATSESILDLLMVSDPDKICQSGVLCVGFSDHNLIFCTRKITRIPINNHKSIRVRSMKRYSKESFVQLLAEQDWSSVLGNYNIEESWSNFKTIFLNILNTLAPLKEVRVKQRTAPWINGEILELIRHRDKHLTKFKRTKNHSDYEQFLCYRNIVNHKINEAKSNYFANAVSENQNQPAKLWKTLKNMGCSTKSHKKSSNIGLVIDNNICFDKFKVANHFNNFFTTIAQSLVDKLPAGSGRYGPSHVEQYYRLKGVIKNMFRLNSVHRDMVYRHLINLKDSKSTGLDSLPAKFVKDGATVVADPITHIINLSLGTGLIPVDMKMARVVPLHKKNNKTETGNYRPVSVLGVISKILERVVYNQVYDYLSHNNLLYNLQSGFRPSFSTDTCLTHLTDYIKRECDKGNFTGMVLLDLQKAFDTVDHNILVSKLESIGLDEMTIKWFKSYLSDRTQLVEVGGVYSDTNVVPCGVPQGSILGPLLFLIYVNDMISATKSKLILYADDSALIASGKDISVIENSLSAELGSVREWMSDNKLSLHLGKTESILFGSKRRLLKADELEITCNGSVIQSKKCVKYLGVTLDQNLSGDIIANNAVSKCTSKLKFLYRNSNNLNMKTKKLLVSSLLQHHFDYACSSWYSDLTCNQKERLQILQNKIIRFILSAPPRTHIGLEQFKRVDLLPVSYRVEQIKLSQMFKIMNGTAPEYLTQTVKRTNSQHSYQTRSCQTNAVVQRVGSHSRKSFEHTAILLWNKLPSEVKQCSAIRNFKSAVKDYMWSSYEAHSRSIYAT